MVQRFWILTFFLPLICDCDTTLKPVVLIPGNGGNQLDVRVDENWEGGDCDRENNDWHRLWLDVWNFRERE